MVLVKIVIITTINNQFLQAQPYTIMSRVVDDDVKTQLLQLHTKLTSNQPLVRLIIYSCYLFNLIFRLCISFTIGSLMTFFFFRVVGILSILKFAALLFWKLCAKCHVSNIVVATMNNNVHYNVCGVKTTIKKVGFLWTSIMLTIGDPILFPIERKWLEVVMGMLEANFFI